MYSRKIISPQKQLEKPLIYQVVLAILSVNTGKQPAVKQDDLVPYWKREKKTTLLNEIKKSFKCLREYNQVHRPGRNHTLLTFLTILGGIEILSSSRSVLVGKIG